MLTPSGACCALDPLFNVDTRGFTNVDGEGSCGDDEFDLFEDCCRLGGVMDGIRKDGGEEVLMEIGLAAAILDIWMRKHRGIGDQNTDSVIASYSVP